MIRRRHTVACLAALAAPGLAPRIGRAQATAPGWPGERPIEVVVPVPPGGALDALARLLMPHVCAHLGEGARFVVINRPGAGTQLGNEAVFNAAPDGYTLGCITAPALPALPIERQVRYRSADFAWLANVVEDPNTVFVLAGSPLRDLGALVATARARPGALTYGSTGVGGDDHIAMLAFEDWAGTPPMVHVPFTGSAPAIQALLGGHLDLLVGNISEHLPLQQEGRIRALGLAAPARFAPLPQVPTFREQGFDLVAGASRGFVGTPGLPAPMRARLEAAFAAALAEPAFLREAERAGMPLRILVGDAYAAMIAEMEGRLRHLWSRRPWRE
ncbi:tripartite tricarboxylate transporter substrate binding protein [Roseicella frigidaeris]|uniref:Tripartite tricarboxylate transporter substrate binding protein n=1 Tax=Roseicella frigidaeris TaxID=2230885 RepID=A0A327M6Y2_9PROT|nr:tripartite tricarboxylate transporter substrate binding protein [Roseicella frigidaeris]RAI58519.1 tripartite tricarboxylate transporter substrate binding protein [Roseicella frigidaeris]